MKTKALALLLTISLLFGTLSVAAGAIVEQNPVHTESGTVEGKEDAFPAIRDALASYQVGETKTIEDDGYIGIPVDITVYNDPDALPTQSSADTLESFWETTEPNPVKLSKTGKPLILYVINTNTTRYGTDSDVSIITSLLAEGYAVMVVDYKNEKRAATPDLDWSLQLVRTKYADYTGGLDIWDGYNYVLPAGYSIKRGVQFFNYQQSAVDGILDYIVEIWNIDLKRTSGDYAKGNSWTVIWGQKELNDGTKVYQDAEGNRCIPYGDTYAYYTQNPDYTYTIGNTVSDPTAVTPLYKKVSDDAVWKNEQTREIKIRYAIAEDFWDCVKPNGDRIDLNLYSDIYYPTNPTGEVPVMMLASSSELRSKATQTATRPISTGFMFTGYAFVNYDHAYTPMSRTDHFGYFEGDTDTRRTAFTLRYHTGVQAQTAAVRQVRALADAYPELFSFNVNAIGAWGHSKGAAVNLLGTAHPELQPNEEFLPGRSDECSGEQQWLSYTDGTPIPSNVQLVYTSNGGGTYFVYEDMVPTVVTQGEQDGTFSNNTHYNAILNALRSLDVAALDMSMEGVGHTTIYGYNEERDYDMYQALFDFCDYILYERAAVCEYILPINGTRGVDVKDDIIIKFTGSIPENEILEKVKIVNAVTNEYVDGIWESAFANNEWTFKPMGLEGGTLYTVIVPETLTDERGNAIKARKSISFRTAYDTAFEAAEVVSSNGSYTLKASEGDENGVYFAFDALNVTNNFKTALRFSVTNKAATTLAVYAVESYNSESPAQSVLGELICEVGVADREIVEVDVSEYVASLALGEGAVFYVKAVKEAGESVYYENDFNDSSSLGLFSSQKFETSPNGSSALQIKMGSSASVLLFPDGITEADYGRRFTITFDILSTIDRPVHARMRLNADKVLENGKYFVDLYNDAHKVIDLKAGEWQRVTLTYVIDDYDYTRSNVQKTRLTIATAGNSIPDEFVYVDNVRITETVIDATLSSEQTFQSIAPTLAVKDARLTSIAPENGGYVVSGKDAESSFDGADGYLVSGESGGMASVDARVSYLAFDIEELAVNMPYALSLSILSGEGTLLAYAIDPKAIAEDFDITKLTYLNAPGLDRTTGGIAEVAMLSGAPLATLTVASGSDCTIGLTRALLDLKARGAKTLLVALVAKDSDALISFKVKSGAESLENNINVLNFDDADGFIMATRRAENVYDTTDVYMQGSYTEQEAMENDGISASTEIFYGTSGKSMKITTPSGRNNVYKFLKLIEAPNRAFTANDVGKTFYVSFKIYLTSAPSAGFNVGLSSVAAGDYDARTSAYVYQKKTIKDLASNQWNTVSYSFEVTEAMVGNRPTKITSDARPVYFCVQALGGTDVYLDDFKYYSLNEAPELTNIARTENTMDSAADVNKVGKNGFESPTTRVSYSTEENLTDGGKGSMKVLHNKSYNRLFVTGLINEADMTAENIGDTYTLIFRVKANRAGTVRLDVGKKSHNANTITGLPTAQDYRISEDALGEWLTFTYNFTLTQPLVDDIASGNNELFGYRIRFTNFGAISDGTVETTLHFDDFVCYRNAPESGGTALDGAITATTSQNTLRKDEASVGTSSDVDGVRKAYFSYDLASVTDVHGAKLILNAIEHQGQSFKLYALTDMSFPEELTFANAPANGTSTEMLLEYVYGAKALGKFTFDAEGKATVDVTDYIRTCVKGTAIFVVTSEQGSLLYLNLDFALTDEALTDSITSNGTVTLANGKLSTNGTSITIHNAFACGEAILPALAPVVIRLISQTNTTFTVSIDGTEYSASATATDGVSEFRFVASADVSASTITITSASEGFTLSGVTIESPTIAKLEAPVLDLYTPVEPVYAFEGVIVGHNMMIGESLSYNLYFAMDKGIQSISTNGKVYDFGALREATFAGATYKLLVLDTVAKNAFTSQTVTVTLENGKHANYEINVSRYLKQFYESARDADEKSLASNMISYLAASVEYFYPDTARANAAAAVRNTVLGKEYDEQNPDTLLEGLISATIEGGGMKGAGMDLGVRPVFYFVADDGYENKTPTFTVDGESVRYTTECVGKDTLFYLIISADMIDKTVCYTIGDCTGTFNVRAYYDWTKDSENTALIHLVERLCAYVDSVHRCFD